MAKTTTKKIKWGRIIAIVLMVIGGLTVVDNVIRLGKEMGNTVMNHRWNMVVVK